MPESNLLSAPRRALRERRAVHRQAPPRRHHPAPVTAPATGRAPVLGWAGAYAVVAGGCLVLLAYAANAARHGLPIATYAYWIGAAGIFLPAAIRLASARASRGERLAFVVILTLAIFLLVVIASPLGFTSHDALGQGRTAEDIFRTGKLFSTNPVVGAYSYYPGLELLVATVSHLTGLGLFPAGLTVIGVARVVGAVALFLLLERVTKSSRAAGLGALVYAANPNFSYFDSQVAYESLALPLLFAALAVTAHATESRSVWATGGAVVLVAAIAPTHHLTSYTACAILVLWVLSQRFLLKRKPPWSLLCVMATALVTTGGWLLIAGGPTQTELGGVVANGFSSLADFLTGKTGAKQLFSAGGQVAPPLERVVGFANVVIVLGALPFLLWQMRRSWRRHALVPVALVLVILYPVTLALRITSAGTETSNRASEYVFLGIAIIAALALPELLSRFRRARLALGAWATLAVVAALGGIIVGWAPYARLPGPYLPAASDRSVEREGIDAALWMRRALGPGHRVATDRINMLLAAYDGLQNPLSTNPGPVSMAELFLAPDFSQEDRTAIQEAGIQYLLVDLRLSRALPDDGSYFEPSGPALYAGHPPSVATLTRFAQISSMDRVFDSGDIQIYGLQRILGTNTGQWSRLTTTFPGQRGVKR